MVTTVMDTRVGRRMRGLTTDQITTATTPQVIPTIIPGRTTAVITGIMADGDTVSTILTTITAMDSGRGGSLAEAGSTEAVTRAALRMGVLVVELRGAEADSGEAADTAVGTVAVTVKVG